jgi:hypothetical protein
MKDTLEIIDHLDAIAARRNPVPAATVEQKETPIETTLAAIETLSGGKSLADLMKPSMRAEAENPITAWAPIVQTVGGVIEKIFDRLPTINQQRIQILILEERRRKLEKGESVENLPALPAATATQAQPVQANAAPDGKTTAQQGQPDPAQLMHMIVQHVIAGFKKAPVGENGEDTGAAMAWHFSDAIEGVPGLPDALANPAELHKLIIGIPDFAPFLTDGRWRKFEKELAMYCVARWAVDDTLRDERLTALEKDEPPQPGPQPAPAA